MKAPFLLLSIFLWSNPNVVVPTAAASTEDITVDRDDYFYSLSECDGAPLACWTAPSTYRFSSETESENPFAAATRSGLRLSAAANEFEAFQVALKSTSSSALQMTAELTEFTPSLGSPSERRVELHTVGFHPTQRLADSLTRLPDSAASFTVSATPSEAATLLYIRIYVPLDADKGDYTTTLILRDASSNAIIVNIPVTLTVFGFQLPISSTFQTQINLSVERFQPSFLTDPVDKLDWAKQFFLEYRMTPKSAAAWPSGLSPKIAWDNPDSSNRCNVLYDEPDERLPYSNGKNTQRWASGQVWSLRRWMVDANDASCSSSSDCPESIRTTGNPGFSSNMLFQFPGNLQPRPTPFCGISIGGDNFGMEAYNDEWSEFVTALDGYLANDNDVYAKSYVYVQNEPQDDQDEKLPNLLCHIYKNAASNLKIAISEEAKPEIAERTDTDGGPCGYDIWIAHVPAFDKEYAWSRLVDFGEQSWFYSLPQDSGTLFSPCENDVGVNDGMNIRVIPWTAFAARIRGWAYYKMDIFFEGDAPLRPKLGAEIFRDAMEDYEYLYLANGGKHPMPNVAEPADPVAKAVGFSFTAWLRDHAKFAEQTPVPDQNVPLIHVALRHELGRFIEGSLSSLATLPVENQGTTDAIYVNFQDLAGDPMADPLVVDRNTYHKVGWEPFDVEKGFGWSGHGFKVDGSPDLSILLYSYRSGGANVLEESYIYNDYGRENQFNYAVADGTWTVSVAVGYPEQSRSDIQDVMVNGISFNNQAITNVQYFTQDVVVTGGFLNLAFGKTFDKYCFISHFYAIPKEVVPSPPPPPMNPLPTPMPAKNPPTPEPAVEPPSSPVNDKPDDPPTPEPAVEPPSSPVNDTPDEPAAEECTFFAWILQILLGWLFGLFGVYFCKL